MKNVLTVSGLTKQYKNFSLNNVSFQVPQGAVVGLIGENGAGKSTTIGCILGLVKKDSGTITILGNEEENYNPAICEQIGVVFDGSNFSEELSPKKLNKVLGDIYHSWDEKLFFSLLEKLSLPPEKKIKTFSKGMKMKLSIVVAFSHHPKFLILDEATSGLDPVMRDDILDMFLDFIQTEENSILVSSHITSDLEKIADYIVFIHRGEIIFCQPKDELIHNYGIIKCSTEQFHAIDKEDIIAYRKQDYEWQILISDKKYIQKKYPKVMIVPATIDEIMLLYIKGGEK